VSSFETSSKPAFATPRARDFDDLAGKGRPLALEDLSAVPEDLRADICCSKRGVLPEEMQLRKEMVSSRLLDACADPRNGLGYGAICTEADPLSGADGATPAVRSAQNTGELIAKIAR
jgi:hypothetical protein